MLELRESGLHLTFDCVPPSLALPETEGNPPEDECRGTPAWLAAGLVVERGRIPRTRR